MDEKSMAIDKTLKKKRYKRIDKKSIAIDKKSERLQ